MTASVVACEVDRFAPPARAIHSGERSGNRITTLDASPYGIVGGGYNSWNAYLGDSIIGALQWAGIKWIRLTFVWYQFQPANRSQFVLPDGLEAVLKAARARGLKVLGSIAYAPAWANGGHSSDSSWAPLADSLSAWSGFVDTLTKHYADSVDAWSIWNEPNCAGFMSVADPAVGDPPEARLLRYVELVRRSAPYIHATGKPVVAGELAWDSHCSSSTVSDGDPESVRNAANRTWLSRVVRSVDSAGGGADSIDVISVHRYGTIGDIQSFIQTYLPPIWDDGITRRPIWLTEFGAHRGHSRSD